MATTYDTALSTDKDWVRLLMGDTNTADAEFSDEEISAALTEETSSSAASGRALRYLVAATLLDAAAMLWFTNADGMLEKQVSELRIRFGTDSSAEAAVRAKVNRLRARGHFFLTPSTTARTFAIIGRG